MMPFNDADPELSWRKLQGRPRFEMRREKFFLPANKGNEVLPDLFSIASDRYRSGRCRRNGPRRLNQGIFNRPCNRPHFTGQLLLELLQPLQQLHNGQRFRQSCQTHQHGFQGKPRVGRARDIFIPGCHEVKVVQQRLKR